MDNNHPFSTPKNPFCSNCVYLCSWHVQDGQNKNNACEKICICNCRVKGPNYILGLGREHEQSEEEQMVTNDSGSGFNEQDTNGRSVRGGVTPRTR